MLSSIKMNFQFFKIKFFIVIILVFLFSSCSSPNSERSKVTISKEEHQWLEKFFRYFMFYDNAIYTLAGSKPLTDMIIVYYDLPEESLREQEQERKERQYFLLNCDNKKDMEFYKKLSSEEKKEKAYLIKDRDFIYNIDELWDKWEKIKSRFSLKKDFLLVKKEISAEKFKKIDPFCKAIYEVFFVNVRRTAFVIQENYDLFRQAVGYDFDPLTIVFELENESSSFWDKIRGEDAWRYSVLWGLLFGFGKENSFSHIWVSRKIKNLHLSEKEKEWADSLLTWRSCQDEPSFSDKNAFSISNFSIPAFKSFTQKDPVVLKYEREREEIKQLYKGKDFVSFTLKLLTEAQK